MICDSCQDGQHDECDGNAWDEEDERWRVCKCDNESHAPAESVKKRRPRKVDPSDYPDVKLQPGQNVFGDTAVKIKPQPIRRRKRPQV